VISSGTTVAFFEAQPRLATAEALREGATSTYVGLAVSRLSPYAPLSALAAKRVRS
jgi:hypothetical protein